jgi:hypothetical protein
VSAISCAFFAGAAFIIWLLLAWAINSLCIGLSLTWPQNGCFCLQTIPSLWRTKLGLVISLVCILIFTRVLLLYISYALLPRVLRPWHPSHSCAYLVHKPENIRNPKHQTN